MVIFSFFFFIPVGRVLLQRFRKAGPNLEWLILGTSSAAIVDCNGWWARSVINIWKQKRYSSTVPYPSVDHQSSIINHEINPPITHIVDRARSTLTSRLNNQQSIPTVSTYNKKSYQLTTEPKTNQNNRSISSPSNHESTIKAMNHLRLCARARSGRLGHLCSISTNQPSISFASSHQ